VYLPSHFREDRPEVLRALMDAYPLAALISSGASGLVANHVPLLFDPSEGVHGVLRGHLARGNNQWRELAAGEVLVIFQGPQAYISPAWYPTKQETGKAVPTWNYATVHAWGPVEVYEDRARLRAFLGLLTERHEEARPNPWSVTDAPADYIDGLLGAIVGIEVRITRIEGKWKVSQNQPDRNRQGVATGLEAESGSSGVAMASLVLRNNGVS